MDTTFDVRVLETLQVNKLAGGKASYTLRWKVAGEMFTKTYANQTQAKGARSRLIAAVGRGEAFYLDTGRPISEARTVVKTPFYKFACDYADLKWSNAAANTRRSTADALVTVMPVMLKTQKRGAEAKALRKALHKYAFNTGQRDQADDEVRALLAWAERNSRPLADLAKTEVIRDVLAAVGSKLDGKEASKTYAARRRAVLWNLCETAVEERLLSVNPITLVKSSAARSKRAKGDDVVDPATVPNPEQAMELLDAVGNLPGTAPRLKAFFGGMYYCALRPGEAVDLFEPNLHIPEEGLGKLLLSGSKPWAGGAWTDDGEERESRQLKHRELGATRWTPCPSKMTALFHWHLATFGTADDGRLFWAARGGAVPGKTYQATWQKARVVVFGAKKARASTLAARPYDLRHAAVSTWLASGVEGKRVADWAGQSLAVLTRIYAKVLDGMEGQAMDAIDAKYGN